MRRFALLFFALLLSATAPVCASAQSLRQIPGKLASISVGGTPSGAVAVWGINAAGDIFEFDGLGFDQIEGLLAQIAVDGTAVWGISASQDVFQFDPEQQGFLQVPGKLKQIAVGGGAVWGSTPRAISSNSMDRPSG